jgi:hypothetical protein
MSVGDRLRHLGERVGAVREREPPLELLDLNDTMGVGVGGLSSNGTRRRLAPPRPGPRVGARVRSGKASPR